MQVKCLIMNKINYGPDFTDILCMGKKNRKGKKNKSNKVSLLQKLKSLNKKTVISIVCVIAGLLIITGTVIGVKTYKKRLADRTVRVAFYGLSENMTSLLKEKIPQEENIILEFDVIPEGAFDAALVKDKYDMLFTWKGEITDALSKTASPIPSKVLETMPRSLRNESCVPILLDHCEFAYSKEVLTKLGKEIPVTYEDFEDYLKASSGVTFSPFFCNGADDRILIDFIGSIVMGKAGLEVYNNLINEMQAVDSLESLLDVKLDGKSFTLRSVLDMLKTWPKEGFTHPAWFNGFGNDLLLFAQEKQISCFFTTLTEHRKIPYNVIKNYESALIPLNMGPENYGVIAPAVSCMLLSDNSNCKRYITAFFTEDAQAELSDKTNLGPVHYQAQAYDMQADDVRFWAASCKGGAVPDLYYGAFQRRPEALKKLCSEIRSYVR